MKAWPANDEKPTADGPVLTKEKSGVLVDIPGASSREVISLLVDMIVKRCREVAA